MDQTPPFYTLPPGYKPDQKTGSPDPRSLFRLSHEQSLLGELRAVAAELKALAPELKNKDEGTLKFARFRVLGLAYYALGIMRAQGAAIHFNLPLARSRPKHLRFREREGLRHDHDPVGPCENAGNEIHEIVSHIERGETPTGGEIGEAVDAINECVHSIIDGPHGGGGGGGGGGGSGEHHGGGLNH